MDANAEDILLTDVLLSSCSTISEKHNNHYQKLRKYGTEN